MYLRALHHLSLFRQSGKLNKSQQKKLTKLRAAAEKKAQAAEKLAATKVGVPK